MTNQFGVPQGSVLGLILFVLYTADVVRLVQLHGSNVHQYADDTHLYESVRDLGVCLDSDMSMHKHVTQLLCSCYGVLSHLHSIRRSLPRSALTTLVISFIVSKVDYCNVALPGLPQRDLDRVQSVVNTAARLSADACKYDNVTQLLRDLHRLRVPERVKFKLCVLMHHCLTGAAPRYLTELAVPVACARRHLLILSCLPLAVQPSVTVRLLLSVHERGTAYHLTFKHLHHHSTHFQETSEITPL